MNRWLQNAIGLASLGALFAFGWASYQVGSAVRENRYNLQVATYGARVAVDPNGPNLPTVFNEARDVTIAILKPCKPGKPETCGLIPAVRDVAVSAGAATVAVQQQIGQTEPLIQAAASAVQDTAGHLNKTIDAAADLTVQARTDLVSLNGSINATTPLLEAYTQSGKDLNSILEQKAITRVIDNTASITESGAGILSDFKKDTDKLTTDYITPQPWWKKIGHLAVDGVVIASHY